MFSLASESITTVWIVFKTKVTALRNVFSLCFLGKLLYLRQLFVMKIELNLVIRKLFFWILYKEFAQQRYEGLIKKVYLLIKKTKNIRHCPSWYWECIIKSVQKLSNLWNWWLWVWCWQGNLVFLLNFFVWKWKILLCYITLLEHCPRCGY